MSFDPSDKVKRLQERVHAFMDEHVYAAEAVFERQLAEAPSRWQIPPIMEELKTKARVAGLWNLFLPESELGAGLTNLEYAPLCEIMGRSAMGPRCKIFIFMGKTDPDAARHQQQSMVLVPRDTPGVRVVRPLTVFGYDDAPHGHAEVEFKDVRVPVDNVLLGEGRGFEIAQGRLGPGRIHHCMRMIGLAERSLEAMVARVKSRVAFGRPLADPGVIREWIADSRMEIEQARLLTLKAAYMMDTVGNKAAEAEVAMIKVVAPKMVLAVIDRAIQAHGGGGVSQDFGLAYAWARSRVMRIVDGPDEVHKRAVARVELRK